MKQIIDEHRRQFLGIATGAVAVGLGVIDLARAETEPLRSSASNASFGAIKQIDAGVLNVGYAEVGPSNGPVAILLHGWPYDIHAFVDVAPILAKAGYRVIVPYLRGYGTTHDGHYGEAWVLQREEGSAPPREHRHMGIVATRPVWAGALPSQTCP